jgi:hypothetical protein
MKVKENGINTEDISEDDKDDEDQLKKKKKKKKVSTSHTFFNPGEPN